MIYPKVSILISVYNQLHCLSAAIESALAQDYPNIEIVISDDYSTDGEVGEFVQRFEDERIKYFRNEQNLGTHKNYQRVLYDYANGVYAIMLNADDYWIDAGFISKAMKIFLENEDVALVFGDIRVYVAGRDTFLEDEMHKNLPSIIDGNWFFMEYPKGYSLPHLTCLYDRKRAIELNFYTNEAISGDWESLLKLIQGSQVGYISEKVGIYVKHSNNYTKDTSLEMLSQADSYIHNVYQFALNRGDFEEEKLNEWLFEMLKRHYAKWLVKLWFLNKEQLPFYKDFLRSNYPILYRNIRWDIRYQGYLLIRRFPFLLKWVFRNVLKQESFILDLLAYQSLKDKR
ncbi:MAG: glycosyltransferase family 2 protein [Chitinophagales bacterium]